MMIHDVSSWAYHSVLEGVNGSGGRYEDCKLLWQAWEIGLHDVSRPAMLY